MGGEGFSFERVSAENYDALRPDYAPEAVSWVAERTDLTERSLVVDLAAGTGRLAKRFEPLGCQVVGVEPAQNMREVMARSLPSVRVLDGSAEAIPLGDEEADAVVVGNAFHHFDADRALAEIHRVLRPGGALALFWIWPNEDSMTRYPELRQVDEDVELVRQKSPMVAAFLRWESGPKQPTGFAPFERHEFPMVHIVPSSRLADLYATSSDVASRAPDDRLDLLRRIEEVSPRLPAVLEFPSRTVVDLFLRER